MSADPRQLQLILPPPAPRDPEHLRRQLEKAFGAVVRGAVVRLVTLTRNRSRIASAHQTVNGWELRLHRCFLTADDATLLAVATFFTAPAGRSRRAALGVLREHFHRHGSQGAEADEKRAEKNAKKAGAIGDAKAKRGRHHDLEALRDSIGLEYFGGALDLTILWGRAPASRRRRRRGGFSIRLGSYEEAQRLVRIHPVLDRREVPGYVVAAVVHHEMLHAVVPPEVTVTRHGERRRRVHTREFRRRERLFEHHDAAEAWLAANAELLARWRAQ